jgi:hypothetical protein
MSASRDDAQRSIQHAEVAKPPHHLAHMKAIYNISAVGIYSYPRISAGAYLTTSGNLKETSIVD